MNHMLITIVYSLPGHNPVISTAVVPFDNHLSYDSRRQQIYDQYRCKKYYELTISML